MFGLPFLPGSRPAGSSSHDARPAEAERPNPTRSVARSCIGATIAWNETVGGSHRQKNVLFWPKGYDQSVSPLLGYCMFHHRSSLFFWPKGYDQSVPCCVTVCFTIVRPCFSDRKAMISQSVPCCVTVCFTIVRPCFSDRKAMINQSVPCYVTVCFRLFFYKPSHRTLSLGPSFPSRAIVFTWSLVRSSQ
jgi:hypothetical protein